MKFQLLVAFFASVALVAASPIADGDAAADVALENEEGYERLGPHIVSITKRAKCGEGRPCAGILRDEACSTHCKESCGKSWGQCGGFAWQTCVCRN